MYERSAAVPVGTVAAAALLFLALANYNRAFGAGEGPLQVCDGDIAAVKLDGPDKPATIIGAPILRGNAMYTGANIANRPMYEGIESDNPDEVTWYGASGNKIAAPLTCEPIDAATNIGEERGKTMYVRGDTVPASEEAAAAVRMAQVLMNVS